MLVHFVQVKKTKRLLSLVMTDLRMKEVSLPCPESASSSPLVQLNHFNFSIDDHDTKSSLTSISLDSLDLKKSRFPAFQILSHHYNLLVTLAFVVFLLLSSYLFRSVKEPLPLFFLNLPLIRTPLFFKGITSIRFYVGSRVNLMRWSLSFLSSYTLWFPCQLLGDILLLILQQVSITIEMIKNRHSENSTLWVIIWLSIWSFSAFSDWNHRYFYKILIYLDTCQIILLNISDFRLHVWSSKWYPHNIGYCYARNIFCSSYHETISRSIHPEVRNEIKQYC